MFSLLGVFLVFLLGMVAGSWLNAVTTRER
jgi:hypothetical protein